MSIVGQANVSELTRFVPACLLRKLSADFRPIAESDAEGFPAAVLFADISGFTSLSERLTERGPAGVEALSRVLNAYFGRLVDLVVAHGGDVLKFAGDALLASWPAAAGSELPGAVHRAARSGLEVQAALEGFTGAEGDRLALRVGVGAGQVIAMCVGGVFGRWEFMLLGDPVIEATRGSGRGRPGEVAIGQDAWRLIHDTASGNPLADGFVRLTSLRGAAEPRPLVVPPVPREADPALRSFIPAAIHRRVMARQSGWLAELRRVTVLFVNLPDLTHATPLATAQRIVRTLQEALYSFEGSVNKLSIDEKGVTLVAALGLPPLAHEDDAGRGVRAGLEMQARLAALGYRCGVGVTTGRVFCGTVGSPTRCEYTLIGDVVNLSARLMQAAHDGILCDRATVEAARSRLQFEALPTIAVKGKAEPIAVFRPLGRSLPAVVCRAGTPMVGRAEERTLLDAALGRLAQERAGGVVLVVGEAGIGKSRLVAELLERSDALGLTSTVGEADAIERSTPYYAWRPVFRQVLGLDACDEGPEACRERVRTQLGTDPGLADLAPLLAVVLSMEWPDSPVTEAMTGEARITNTNELLVHVLGLATARGPLQLILEDCHWLDSASWSLAGRVAREGLPILLVIVTRPLAEPLPREYLQFLREPTTRRVELAPLSAADTVALVARRLNVREVPEWVAALIHAKSQGNPFFSEELAYALRDSGLIRIEDGRCRLAPGSDLGALAFPDTVQGVVTSRIDRLTPQEQLMLKVASVIGRIFSYRILYDISPVEQDRTELAGQLASLTRIDLILPDDPEPDPVYSFRHVITQEVAYNLMSLEQRRQLHRAVAEWYERNHPGDLSPYYPLLARHWSMTDQTAKAVEFHEKAGEHAMRDYANEEAVDFFSQALCLDGRRDTPSSAARRGHWEAQLAEAYYRLGLLGRSLEHLHAALRLLGHRFPTTGRGGIAAMLRELTRQFLHRLRPGRSLGRDRERAGPLLAAARVFERMAQVYYLNNQRVLSIHAAVRALNLSEAAGRSPELARSYANVAVASGLMSLHAAAEAYTRRAREVAGFVDQPECTSYVEFVSGLYWVTVGRWQSADEALGTALRIAERGGEWRRWDESAFTLATSFCWRGDLMRGVDLARTIAESGATRGVAHVQLWGLAWQLWCLLPREDRSDRLDTLEAALAECLATHGDVPLSDQILVHGVRALVLWRRGEGSGALEEARAAEQIIARTEQISQYLLAAYASLLELYTGLWEAARGYPAETRDLARRTRRIGKVLGEYRRMYPIGQPHYWLYRGRFHWLSGARARALQAWGRGLAAAQRLCMPYEQGLIHAEIGRCGGPDARPHLTQARELFERVQADADLKRWVTGSESPSRTEAHS